MSGELQTIPARHGVATFVPRGRTIKVVNTYGKQVVSMWAFSLGPPPEEGDDEEGESEKIDDKKIQEEAEELKKNVEEGDGKEATSVGNDEGQSKDEEKGEESASKDEKDGEKEKKATAQDIEKPKEDAEDPPEEAPDADKKEGDNEKSTEVSESSKKQPAKRTWGSYLPSIPYRNKGNATKSDAEKKPDAKEEKAQNDANTQKWSSYLPTGKGFSSYIPSVQIPDSKGVTSAFKSSIERDPNKSYAEQLYEFSKTPVGAGTIAAATGSGYASSVYAAYSAYASAHPSSAQQPPMEYLSLPHTRAASYKLVPDVNDELLTNLRNPIITLIEDTSPGAHDTLTAACDANLYTALGVEKPEEHGSCAENLVLALKELNETAGLKGAKAVGADITVNIAPTPLHLFMNAPIQTPDDAQSEGAGAKGTVVKVEEPKGKKRCYVRFRAERDVVIVFSSCPNELGSQNGGRCMAANFMVEDVQEGEDLASSVSAASKKKGAPRKLNAAEKKKQSEAESKKEDPKKDDAKKPEPQKEDPKKDDAKKPEPQKEDAKPEESKPDDAQEEDTKPAKKPAPRKLGTSAKSPEKDEPKKQNTKKEEDAAPEEAPKADDSKSEAPKADDSAPKKKPKKLQVRGAK